MKWQLMKRQVGGGKERGMEGGREGGREGGSFGTGSGITAFFSKDHWGA